MLDRGLPYNALYDSRQLLEEPSSTENMVFILATCGRLQLVNSCFVVSLFCLNFGATPERPPNPSNCGYRSSFEISNY